MEKVSALPLADGPLADGPRLIWTPLDECLWHSCDILADVVEGRLDRRPPIVCSAELAPGDRALAAGPAQRESWRGLGDGIYTRNNIIAVGTSAFVVGSLLGPALGNAARRRNAARAAQPRWISEGSGELTVAEGTAHFGHPTYWLDLDWTGLDAVDLAAADVFQTRFRDIDNGRQTVVRLHTPWASLMFALAALTAFPTHPRLLDRRWLPPDFEQRCLAAGRPCRPAARLVLDKCTR